MANDFYQKPGSGGDRSLTTAAWFSLSDDRVVWIATFATSLAVLFFMHPGLYVAGASCALISALLAHACGRWPLAMAFDNKVGQAFGACLQALLLWIAIRSSIALFLSEPASAGSIDYLAHTLGSLIFYALLMVVELICTFAIIAFSAPRNSVISSFAANIACKFSGLLGELR